ncbi:SusC/RagA family TonB-linked outer membrane protein [Sphingobacterium sp. SGL-16]|uniref:SusC/RagA family TonB-linked outer membrane protein n=1 Tax=Sphingobacterium sp. SGL-16 TaxID=2710883 RepID=UPI0013ED2788|nr:SusC/RagA family TonB-linked outer membrane protein [Sphingobacterium sp. SGL-16]NGM74160.1 SusC/RagA family TonB-linked outer membrane protein [Sphingobacterium sp. SGL-16]
MKQKLLSTFFALTCVTSLSFAQTRDVSGVVTSTDGTPISGASIVVAGTNTVTQTDGLGRFKLSVASGSTLTISYIGFTTQKVNIGNSNSLSIVLESENQTLDEVVVVGYGSTTKEAFTGSAKKITAEQLERKNVSNISQALAGEVAGVTVVNSTGQPGTAATIRIRGLGSVNGNRSPLYVVDGVPFTGNLTSINPSDIESSTVLKDGTATAIYGSRGANGVIVITTKSGRGKNSFIEADVNLGTNAALIPRYEVIKSPETYIGLSWESLYNHATIINNADPIAWANTRLFSSSGINPLSNLWNATAAELIDPETRTVRPGVTRKFDPENWEDYAFQNAFRADYNLKMGGSSENSNYFTSFGYLTDKGYSIKSDFERFSGRLNLDNKIKPWLNSGLNLSYSRTTRNNNGQTSDSGSIFWFMDNMPPIFPLFERDADGEKIPDPIYGGYLYDYGRETARRFANSTNSLADATYGLRRAYRNEINGRAYLNFNIIEGLTFENSLGINYYHNKSVSRNSKFYGNSFSTNGAISQTRTETFSYTLLNLLRYRKAINDFNNIEVLAAHEIQDFSNNVLSGSKRQLVRDDSEEFDNAVVTFPFSSYTEGFSVESFFGQVNYDFNNKYYLSGSIRRDGSSRFENNKWGTFGSIGGSWVVSKEDFMSNQNIFDYLKVKMSYGIIGDQSVGSYYPGIVTFPITNLDDLPAIGAPNVGNPDLTWERAKMFQTGVDFEIGRYLTGSLEYYIKNTTDLIFDRRVGPSNGYALIRVNDGELQNKGLEFDLTGHILKSPNYFLDLGINGEIFKNKITKMPIEPSTGQPKILDPQSPYGWGKGRSIYDFYIRDFVGVDPEDGRSEWTVHYIDKNGNGTYDGKDVDQIITSLAAFENVDNAEILEGKTKVYQDATIKYINKTAIPKIRGAFNLAAGYKGLTLNAQFLYSLGGYAYDGAYASLMGNGLIGSNNWHMDMLQRWQKAGDITDVPRLSNNQDANVSSVSSRFITKSDYLALNNVRLTYNFNQGLIRSLGLEGLSVWASGDNLYLSTKRKGFNPMVSEAGTSSVYTYSPLSTFSFGLRAKF